MKKIKFLGLAIVTGMLILTACNNGNKKQADEKNETGTTEIKKDTGVLNVSSASPSTKFTINNLPVGVKEFVSKNYSGYTIVSADSDPLCGGGPAVDVAIKKTGVPNLSLIFKPDGSFVQQEEDVPLSTASDKIRSVLKTKYADYSAGNQIEKLTLVDKTIEYMVDLNKGSVNKEVIFSVDGNIVCEN